VSRLYVNADPSTLGGTILGAGFYTALGNYIWAYVLPLSATHLGVRLYDGTGFLAWGSNGGGFDTTGLSLSFTAEFPIT
jgi:hypothetical protein